MNSFQAGLTNIRNRLELALQKYGGSFDFVSFNTEILSGRDVHVSIYSTDKNAHLTLKRSEIDDSHEGVPVRVQLKINALVDAFEHGES